MIGVINVEAHREYSLSVQQTPQTSNGSQPQAQGKTVSWQTLEQRQQRLHQLPPNLPRLPPLARMDDYLEHLKHSRPYLPPAVKYCCADGFYSKQKFVAGVVALDLHLIRKLRSDADVLPGSNPFY